MAPTTNNLKLVFGGGAFIQPEGWSEDRLTELLDYLEKEGIHAIDTAQAYGESESIIGKSKAAARGFQIDTKVSGGLAPTVRATKENVIKSGEESLEKLATDQVDVYYIHAPDRKWPFKDTLEGINELYKAGKFKRFGLSNFTPEEVEDVVRIAKENNFVLPSVYQGNYNAVGRLIETQLFPILRKHNIAFYAYSPVAGGFLTKTPEDITLHGKGRFDKSSGFFGQMYNSLYNTPVKLDFLAKFGKIASAEGISQAELAYRWVTYNSHLEADKGDAVIVGSSFGSQLAETLKWLKKGPLSQETADKLDDIWKGVEGEATSNCHDRLLASLEADGASTTVSPPPIPPPVPVETHPNRAGGLKPPLPQRPPDPTRLAPEHAYGHSQPRFWHDSSAPLRPIDGVVATPAAVAALRPPPAVPGTEPKKIDVRKFRDGRRKKRKGVWKKLLWVRQSYPDNYTDVETFLDHLQRNPRLRPYDFWPLVADSTVIVQHVCSVVIFVCCFVGIFQNRVSPVSVVGCGSIGTVLGWILWDWWVCKEQNEAIKAAQFPDGNEVDDGSSASSTASQTPAAGVAANGHADNVHGLGLNLPPSSSEVNLRRRSTGLSVASLQSVNPIHPGMSAAASFYSYSEDIKHVFSSRNRQRLATIKSALLIYCALLGLSPILKSLTKSTASDSIWALSCWLMIINIFSFDYGSDEGKADATKFPASLSTNAALMASTVLASRLPSTTHVFSLTLFSIEVFGLFPVFRRQLRHVSWTGHVLLTFSLVLAAGAGTGIALRGGWAAAIVGAILSTILTALAMGSCSWWLISLQKYKNVVIGPWDPARPIIRGNWDLS